MTVRSTAGVTLAAVLALIAVRAVTADAGGRPRRAGQPLGAQGDRAGDIHGSVRHQRWRLHDQRAPAPGPRMAPTASTISSRMGSTTTSASSGPSPTSWSSSAFTARPALLRPGATRVCPWTRWRKAIAAGS